MSSDAPPAPLPSSTTRPQRFYEVQEGDTPTEIADTFGVPILSIMELNAIRDQNAIYAGQLLELPDPASISGTDPESPLQAPTGP